MDVVTHWVNPSEPRVEMFGDACRVIRIGAGRKAYVPKNEMIGLLPEFYEEMKNTIDLSGGSGEKPKDGLAY